MAEVYRAEDLMLHRHVAVKVLAAHLADDADYADRFRAEAHRAGSLSHPNLVPVYHAGETEVQGKRLLYLVMPLLQESLRDLRRREGRLPAVEASRLVLHVADGLEAAHQSGIVHLDVKPGNVLLDEVGCPRLGDFGIARELSDTTGDGAPTESEQVVGTPEYMAPEQLRGTHVDQRADVYALGAVFYELLTGHPPFLGTTPFDVAAHALHAPLVPPSVLEPQVTPAVEQVVLKALARDPADRYATAGAFALALHDACKPRHEAVRLLDLSRPTLAALPDWDDDLTPTGVRTPAPPNSGWWPGARIWRQLFPVVIAATFALLLVGTVHIFSTGQSSVGPLTGTAPTIRAPAAEEISGATNTSTEPPTTTVAPPTGVPLSSGPPATHSHHESHKSHGHGKTHDHEKTHDHDHRDHHGRSHNH